MGDGNVTGLPSQGSDLALSGPAAVVASVPVSEAVIRGDPALAGEVARDAAGQLAFLTATDPAIPVAVVLAASTPSQPDGYLGADPLWEPHLRENRSRIRGVAEVIHERWLAGDPPHRRDRPTVLVLGSGSARDFDLPHLAQRFNVILVDTQERFFADAMAGLTGAGLRERVRTVTDDVTGIMAELDRQLMSDVDFLHMPTLDEFLAHVVQVLQTIDVPVPDFSKYAAGKTAADGRSIQLVVSSSLLSQLHEILDNLLRTRLMQVSMLGDMSSASNEAYALLAQALRQFSGKLVAAHTEGLARLVHDQQAVVYLSTDMGVWPATQSDVPLVHSRSLVYAPDGVGLGGLQSLFDQAKGMTLFGPARWLWHTEAHVVRPYEALVMAPANVSHHGRDTYQVIMSPVWTDLESAAQIPVVKNKLLLKAQAAYQMAWKELVNPDSRPITVVYNAMGADVSTVLLATDATTIIGLDNRELVVEELRVNLEFGNAIGTPEWLLVNIHLSSFDEDMEVRRDQGFWSEKMLECHGTAFMIAIELKHLGVDLGTVQVSAEGDVITITFPWAYPGAGIKERRLVYTQGNLSRLVAGDLAIAIDKIDGLYQKAANHSDPEGYRNIWEYLASHLNPDGFVLMGTTELGQEGHLPDHDERLHLLGGDFQEITVARPYDMAMSLAMGELDYGQKLFGYKRKCVGMGGSMVAKWTIVNGGEVLVSASGVASGEIVADAAVGAEFTAPVEDAVVGADLRVRPVAEDSTCEVVEVGELEQGAELRDGATTPGGLVTHLGPPVARAALAKVVTR